MNQQKNSGDPERYSFWKEGARHYQIDPVWGVLFPRSPEQVRHPSNDVWYQTAADLPNITQAGNVRETLRSSLEGHPFQIDDTLFDLNQRPFDPKLYAAMRDVAFIAQAYMWGDDPSKMPPDNILPAFIAQPYETIAGHLGAHPAMAYPYVVLINAKTPEGWQYEDIASIRPELFDVERRFTPHPRVDGEGKAWDDEGWFYKVHMATEAAASFALKAIKHCFETVFNPEIADEEKVDVLETEFGNIKTGIKHMIRCIKSMYEGCDVRFFGTAPFRLYLQGSHDIKVNGETGVVFEGTQNLNHAPSLVDRARKHQASLCCQLFLVYSMVQKYKHS